MFKAYAKTGSHKSYVKGLSLERNHLTPQLQNNKITCQVLLLNIHYSQSQKPEQKNSWLILPFAMWRSSALVSIGSTHLSFSM